MKNKIFAIILLIFSLFSCKQNEIPSNFVETLQPKSESTEWYNLNYSEDEFDVKITNGKLEIVKAVIKNTCELKISNGKLLGINHGEFGGKLTFVPDDKSQKEIEIKNGNVKFIFMFHNKIYFIEGLTHGFSEGNLYQLNFSDNKFTYNKILHFEDAPQAFTIYNDKLLIASYENFYIVEDFKKQLIFKETFWGGLYPNSIAIINENNVYLGIRSGIVKLDLPKKNIKFYKYIKH